MYGNSVLGLLAWGIESIQSYQFRLFWAEMLFFVHLPRRRLFGLRALVWLPFLLLPLFFNNSFDSTFFIVRNYTWSFLVWFAYSIFALAFCHRLRAEQLIYISVVAYSMQNLFASMKYFFLYRFSPVSPLLFQSLTLVLMLALYALFCLTFIRSWVRKFRLELRINKTYLLVSAIAILLILNVLSSYMQNTSLEAVTLSNNCLLFSICTALIVLLLAGVYDRSYVQYEKDTLRQLLLEQEKQRSLSERTIAMINMKCHDMKHQLLALRRVPQDADGEAYMRETLDFIRIYDSFFKTGNKYLDLILTEKSLLCQSEKIALTCTVDGAALDFMSATDIYSFFGNALDNAIECQQRCPEEKRSISVSVCRKNGGFVSIVIKNYNERQPEFRDGLPRTSKGDKSLHGFGTKSMHYIISDLYGGNLLMRQEGDAFVVSALLSLDAQRREP